MGKHEDLWLYKKLCFESQPLYALMFIQTDCKLPAGLALYSANECVTNSRVSFDHLQMTCMEMRVVYLTISHRQKHKACTA